MSIIKHYTEIGKENWNNFVNSNSMGWACHLWDVNIMDWDGSLKNMSFAIVESETNEIKLVFQMYQGGRPTILTKFIKYIFKIQLPNNKYTCYKKFLTSRWGYVLKDGLYKKQIKAVKQVFEKGVNLPNNTIIASNSLVNKKFNEENLLIGGCPAKIIRKNAFWCAGTYGSKMKELEKNSN